MSDPRDVAGTLQDLSVLYELSLCVGQSIELDECCDAFLQTLMARKSLGFSSVWIRDRLVTESGLGDGLTQVYANPAFRSPARHLSGDHPLVRRVAAEPFFSAAHGGPGFEAIVTETGIERGAFAVYRLGEIGLLKLHSLARQTPFSELELRKLRHVVDKFTVSLEGCLDHARVRSAERTRRELELQMLHAQKLESLGLLAGGVAHDFNNLLTVVLGNAELVRPAVADAEARENVANILDAATRAADLCAQLLAYSGRGRFAVGPVDLNAVISEMLRLTKVAVSKKARVERSLGEDLPPIEGDPSQIRQVVMNLLTNASEALGAASGDLRVETGTVRLARADLAGFQLGDLREPGEYVYLEVQDSGCGVAPGSMRRIFDPFYTTKFTGRGLGLAAVLGIVRGHRGAIRVESRSGAGTRVRIVFPRAVAGALAPRAAPPVMAPRQSTRREGTVLVVDDEEAVRVVLGDFLAAMGFDVRFAADGGEALRAWKAGGERIDLVVLDLTMPVMGGVEVLEELARTAPEARVVLTSGYSQDETSALSAQARPAAFLEKPFRFADVERVVAEVLGHAPRASQARSALGPAQ